MKQLTAGVTRWWVGRDNATLPEPTSSHRNCLKTRRLPPVGCTLCWHAFDWKTSCTSYQRLNPQTRFHILNLPVNHHSRYISREGATHSRLSSSWFQTYTS